MKSILSKVGTTLGMIGLGLSLSGCVVAAVPLMMGAVAAGAIATGFVVYKTVQTTGGGTVRVAFGSKDSKTAATPPPLPAATVIAVSGSGNRERKFTETLQAGGQFRSVQQDNQLLANTDADRTKAWDGYCRSHRVDLVLAAIDQGQSVSSNMLSFKRGSSTDKLQLQAYDCAKHAVAWEDPMQIIIEVGGKPVAQSEVDAIAGQAWAERVLKAKGG